MSTYRDTLHVDPDGAERLRERGLVTVQALLDCLGDRVVAWSRSSDTIRVQAGRPPRSLYVKRYHYSTRTRRVRALLRGVLLGSSRARREYATLHGMRSVGIAAVRPIAWGERRRAGLLRTCVLITEGVAGGQPLMRLLRGPLGRADRAEVIRARQRLVRSLAEQIRAMHQRGYAHGALFWRNIVVCPLEDGAYACHFLDPDGRGRMWRRGPGGRKAIRDVAALAAMADGFLTRTECLRFAKWYLGRQRVDTAARRWVGRVLRVSARYRDHELYRWRLATRHADCEEDTPSCVCAREMVTGHLP